MRHPNLRLELADTPAKLKWAQETVETKHYMRQQVHPISRPVAYIAYYVIEEERNGEKVIVAKDKVGCLIFNRMQSSYCKGWYGSLEDVRAGRAEMSQWEILNLARCWLDPHIQRKDSEYYVENAATQLIGEALKRVPYEYLIMYPPAFMDKPYQLRQCISYCQSDRFFCTLYLAANFFLKRTNKQGLRTYVRNLRPLTQKEIRKIKMASLANQTARKKRAKKAFTDTYTLVPLLRHRLQRQHAA